MKGRDGDPMEQGVLVTAYGPFEEVTENVTGLVAPELGYPFQVLEVSYGAVEEFLEKTNPASFDVLLSFGHDPRGEHVRVETVGRNSICGRPDMRDEVHGPGPINPKGPAQIAATLWQAPEALLETDHRRPSTDAGGYLCNYILYRALQSFPEKRIGFLHLPPKEKMEVYGQVRAIRDLLRIVAPAAVNSARSQS